MSFTTVLIGFLVLLIIYAIKKKDPEPIFGIYSVKGKRYYLKYFLFGCVYYFRKYANKNKAAGTDGRAGQGVKAIANPVEMDRPQLLSNDEKAFDAVFMISAKSDENGKGIYVIAGSERRPMGMCNGLFYIGLPGKGLLLSKKLPDTVLFGADVLEFGGEGLKIKPVEYMKKWTLTYKGQMRYQNNPEELVDVDFHGEWCATTKYFDYDTDLHPPAVIRSIAKEKWSRQYFEGLKTAHQSHYEQFGELKCKFKIGSESFQYTLPSFRDHSYGQKRDWSLMHRYAFHHIFLKNGTSISVGVICQPCTASVFETGEVAVPDGNIYPVKWCDLRLHQHGEGGAAPRDYAFSFKAGNEIYHVQVQVEYEAIHYVSKDWEARMVERFCSFTVNGVPGKGVSEFHYRRRGGRPLQNTDPQWYLDMCAKENAANYKLGTY